ncbi:MAG: 50S ribosomal protein L30 [Thermoplasmata archaeon M11B2D]|nr:MAG: 50S ribosomal protein L30 [Thermoplasmata archaeon M11B2D]PNX53464.1 MAG: 50S ribosomal protein L30 [Thermoplasmata archaeon M9B2D]
MVYAVIRIRGTVNVKPDIKKTMELLRLTHANRCVLLEENDVYKGMLQMVKDYTTWGEINKETLSKLLSMRGKRSGEKPLTEEYLKKATSYDSFEKLSEAILDKKVSYKEIPEIKPYFRLNPPKKGHRTVKRAFVNKGSLGYRKENINTLIERML